MPIVEDLPTTIAPQIDPLHIWRKIRRQNSETECEAVKCNFSNDDKRTELSGLRGDSPWPSDENGGGEGVVRYVFHDMVDELLRDMQARFFHCFGVAY